MTLTKPYPEGDYAGEVLGRYRFLNAIWSGKRFTYDAAEDRLTVVNRVLGRWMIEGEVAGLGFGNRYLIRYPVGLMDVLVLNGDDRWEGTMALGPMSVKFVLTKRNGWPPLAKPLPAPPEPPPNTKWRR